MTAPRELSAHTRVLTILGDPVVHSRSPVIHNAAFNACGLDAVYVAMRCTSQDAAALIRGIARAGGGGNVTAPHKQIAAQTVERATDVVQLTGACNTFWSEDGLVVGDNTDVAGFRAALNNHFGPAKGQRVLLIGAGGAARAVVAGLMLEECERIDVLTRSPARVEELIDLAHGRGITINQAQAERLEHYDVAINATPLGHQATDDLPLNPVMFRHADGILDLVYANGQTALVRAARAAGLKAFDGTEMLLQQAAAAFERWFQIPAPIDVMRAALK